MTMSFSYWLIYTIYILVTTKVCELTKDAVPVRHASHRVPEAIRPKVKVELDRFAEESTIKPVDAPTDWVNSLVVATKHRAELVVAQIKRDRERKTAEAKRVCQQKELPLRQDKLRLKKNRSAIS